MIHMPTIGHGGVRNDPLVDLRPLAIRPALSPIQAAFGILAEAQKVSVQQVLHPGSATTRSCIQSKSHPERGDRYQRGSANDAFRELQPVKSCADAAAVLGTLSPAAEASRRGRASRLALDL